MLWCCVYSGNFEGFLRFMLSPFCCCIVIRRIVNELVLCELLLCWRRRVDHQNSLMQTSTSYINLSEGKHWFDWEFCFWIAESFKA